MSRWEKFFLLIFLLCLGARDDLTLLIGLVVAIVFVVLPGRRDVAVPPKPKAEAPPKPPQPPTRTLRNFVANAPKGITYE